MNLLQVIKHLQGIALTIPNIRSANEGSVYTIQNGNPHQKYMSFVVSQTTHRTDDLFDYFGLNLFLIDRLTDELEANRLQIQSLAKDCLTNILIKFCTSSMEQPIMNLCFTHLQRNSLTFVQDNMFK